MSKGIQKFMAAVCCAALVFGAVGCGSKEPEIKDVAVTEIAQEVQKAYGENYVATYQFTDEEVQNLIGINPDDCEELAAYGSMISVHVDKFIAVKAKTDKKDSVKTALEAYQTTLKDDTMQYPMNIPKIQASEIKEYGDYLFFIMLGFAEDEAADEEKLLEQYKEQNAVAVKAIEDLLYGVQ